MSNVKCDACGLVNFATSDSCRRCGTYLTFEPAPVQRAAPPAERTRGFWQWMLWTAGMTVSILIAAYLSLIVTSEGLTVEERAMVSEAIDLLEKGNFEREVRTLRRLATYRRTDNWWNRYVGHQTAFAATNFPFGVVTLYPAFFKLPVDATERATILLHETHHVLGEPEERALQHVWMEKARLGWTAAGYGHTRVWKNTREWTEGAVPTLFNCGVDGESDCVE
jgi:hypothetical protein